MTSLADILRAALFALRGNWLRSALTALGVIIGIAAVIVMVSVGQGTQAELDNLISRLGSNRLEIFAGAMRSGGVRMGAGSQSSLTSRDAEAIRSEIATVQYVSPVVRGGAQLIYGENNWSTNWYGIIDDYFAVENRAVAQGEGFSERDYTAAAKSAIIGATVKRELFGDADPVGETIRVGRVPVRVVGVLAAKGQGSFGQDADDVVLVPLETARRRLAISFGGSSSSTSSSSSGSTSSTGSSSSTSSSTTAATVATAQPVPDNVQSISVGVGRAQDMAVAEQDINALLRQRHRIPPDGEDDFTVRNLSEMVSTRTQTTRLMSWLLGAVATISLIVGGIGIMNIMLVSVTERIREIGLRMAVGAGPREIQLQFLAEAMLISLGGGIIGIAIGIVGALLASRIGALPVQLDLQVVGLATVFSVATGLFFGFYPARKAAQLDPIEALRHQG